MKRCFLAAAGLLSACASIASAVDVYVFDMRGTAEFFRFDLATPTNRVFLNNNMGYTSYAMDFNADASQLYIIRNTTAPALPILGTLNTTNGVFTQIGDVTGLPDAVIPTGLTFTPTGAAYVSTGASLYTLDVTTGALTLVGAYSGPATLPLMIEIASDADGYLYGHDIATDSLLLIDPVTAVCQTIGGHGLAANFAQGMDFDWSTNSLYATIYTGGGTGRFVSWNTSTGAVTTILDTGTAGWNMEMEMSVASGLAPGSSTRPIGYGYATPNQIGPGLGDDTLLTVRATPGTNPASTGLAVVANLSAIGGSPTQAFYDDGTHGDVAAGDNTFSFLFDGNGAEAPGSYWMPFTVSDSQARSTSARIALRVVAPPPVNDFCGSATSVGEGTFAFSLESATADGYAVCTNQFAAPDVWFQYTPTFTGTAVLNTCVSGTSGLDTVMNVFDVCPSLGGQEFYCADDGCNTYWGGSRIAVPVVAGQPWLVRIGNFAGTAAGSGSLNIHELGAPANDACASATNVGEGVHAFSLQDSTNDGGAGPNCAAQTNTAPEDVWIRYTPSANGTATASMCGLATFDSVIEAYDACAGTQITCGDDTCGVGGGPSLITFQAAAGQAVLIRITEWEGGAYSSGQIDISLESACDPDVNCDGVPDQDDVACIILAVAGDLSCFCQADPDFNGDGVPDQDDVAAVILTVAGAPCP